MHSVPYAEGWLRVRVDFFIGNFWKLVGLVFRFCPASRYIYYRGRVAITGQYWKNGQIFVISTCCLRLTIGDRTRKYYVLKIDNGAICEENSANTARLLSRNAFAAGAGSM